MADEAYRFRVALIGDSNAFSFEVPFDQAWGYYLQRLVGDGLNPRGIPGRHDELRGACGSFNR